MRGRPKEAYRKHPYIVLSAITSVMHLQYTHHSVHETVVMRQYIHATVVGSAWMVMLYTTLRNYFPDAVWMYHSKNRGVLTKTNGLD